ncbi:TPA: Pycsar system effector family protein [Bacillus cereus]|uniref:Pycsar system effector family protein n=1 Tax=Bacillus cereus TaxID=1396 RepID=UPI000BF3639A|nr:Pycsar system effector family protein [Bacillus cereus]PFL47415.1 hypothetical protein COJ34_20475 [Bacillus cereus]PFQ99267.1 hypothetical protein COK32_05215 [Bacillus cereus]PGY81748.1 hypothetical protein COE36_25120 [Bacillus cereus]
MSTNQTNNNNIGQTNDEIVATLDRINFWISNCDTKISFSLAFAGILLGGFFSSSIITGSLDKVIKKIIHMDSIQHYWQTRLIELTILVLFVFIVLMAISLTYLFRALKGSINADVYQQHGLTTDSKVFFGSIANQSFQSFKQKVIVVSDENNRNDYLSQVYINSKICQRKFQLYNSGVQFLIYSTISFVLLNILFLFIK